MGIRIPAQLADAVDEDDYPERRAWLAALPEVVEAIATEWELSLGEPFEPGGQCAWVAPARAPDGTEVVLKVGWRHREAEHEADALRVWDGDGAVRCLASRRLPDTIALLLERCDPGVPLGRALRESEQDVVIAQLLGRLWARPLPLRADHPFASLREICDEWARDVEIAIELGRGEFDAGLAYAGAQMLRELAASSEPAVLLCTDLHAGNVLSAQREPWLVIDPKPFAGDPAYDVVQHMLNCDERLAGDPCGLAERMAGLAGLPAPRVKAWLFARCAQESVHDSSMRAPALALGR